MLLLLRSHVQQHRQHRPPFASLYTTHNETPQEGANPLYRDATVEAVALHAHECVLFTLKHRSSNLEILTIFMRVGGFLSVRVRNQKKITHLRSRRSTIGVEKKWKVGQLRQRWTWVGSIHGLGWAGLNEKYCGIVAEYGKTHTFHGP